VLRLIACFLVEDPGFARFATRNYPPGEASSNPIWRSTLKQTSIIR
jgi:hypothetical protein